MNLDTSEMSVLLNPFVVESPERLTPQDIVDLFVESYTSIEVVKQRKHTFIWGSRGAGKSMMLRYLEPRCQFLAGRDTLQKLPFLAVYCPCKEGYFNKTDLGLLPDLPAAILTEHLLNIYIAGKTLDCLRRQFEDGYFSERDLKTFSVKVMSLFDVATMAKPMRDASEENVDALERLQIIFSGENRRINVFLRQSAFCKEAQPYTGVTTGYHDFLLPFMEAVQGLPRLEDVPILVMLDDADRLTGNQQVIINSWIGNRDQRTVCFKVAAEFGGYKTFRKHLAKLSNEDDMFKQSSENDFAISIAGGGWIESPHDYSEVDVNGLYTHKKTDYTAKVRLIANRRLELGRLATKNIEDFLPSDPVQTQLLEDIRKSTAEEWEKAGKPGRQEDYVYRYATARLFQDLRRRKQRRNYAGFDSMVHLSSGTIRSFLEPCYLMFDRCRSQQENPSDIPFIPPAIQDEVLLKYSEEFLINNIEKIRLDLPPEELSLLESLTVLLYSLGTLFSDRLQDPNAREARLFSFTVRGLVPPDVDRVLRMGVRHRYFQFRTYGTKEGGGRERWYILNRRLCPIFNLDPSGFEGRISLLPEHLALACRDTAAFVRLRLRQIENSNQLDFFLDDDREVVT